MRLAALLCCALLSASALAAGSDDGLTGGGGAVGKLELSKAARRADELDKQFGRLREQQSAEVRIWELWVQSDSATADVLLFQATKAMNDQQFDVALPMFDQLAKAYPSYAEVYNKRATLNFLKGDYEASLKDIEKVLELEPRHFGALSGRGMIYRAQGKDSLALKALREALHINPNMEGVKSAVKELEKLSPEI